MTQLADIHGYRQFHEQLYNQFTTHLARMFTGLTGNYLQRRDTLFVTFPMLIDPYVAAISAFTATWIEDLFMEATGQLPDTTVLDGADPKQVEKAVAWAVGPWFGETGDVLERLTAAGSRIIAQAGRRTALTSPGR